MTHEETAQLILSIRRDLDIKSGRATAHQPKPVEAGWRADYTLRTTANHWLPLRLCLSSLTPSLNVIARSDDPRGGWKYAFLKPNQIDHKDREAFDIKTLSGRQMVAGEECKLLTQGGFLNMFEIEEGDWVAVAVNQPPLPFEDAPNDDAIGFLLGRAAMDSFIDKDDVLGLIGHAYNIPYIAHRGLIQRHQFEIPGFLTNTHLDSQVKVASFIAGVFQGYEDERDQAMPGLEGLDPEVFQTMMHLLGRLGLHHVMANLALDESGQYDQEAQNTFARHQDIPFGELSESLLKLPHCFIRRLADLESFDFEGDGIFNEKIHFHTDKEQAAYKKIWQAQGCRNCETMDTTSCSRSIWGATLAKDPALAHLVAPDIMWDRVVSKSLVKSTILCQPPEYQDGSRQNTLVVNDFFVRA